MKKAPDEVSGALKILLSKKVSLVDHGSPPDDKGIPPFHDE